jgi:hypothetical protein
MREEHIIDNYVFSQHSVQKITSQIIKISRTLVFYVSVLPYALNFRCFSFFGRFYKV